MVRAKSLKRYLYDAERVERFVDHSCCISLEICLISSGWNEWFSLWRTLFQWSHYCHAICQILLCVFEIRRIVDFVILRVLKWFCWQRMKFFDQNPSMNFFHPILACSLIAVWSVQLEGLYEDCFRFRQFWRLWTILIISLCICWVSIHSCSLWSYVSHRVRTPSPLHWRTWSVVSLSCPQRGQLERFWCLYLTSMVPTPQKPVTCLHNHCCWFQDWFERLLWRKFQSTWWYALWRPFLSIQ